MKKSSTRTSNSARGTLFFFALIGAIIFTAECVREKVPILYHNDQGYDSTKIAQVIKEANDHKIQINAKSIYKDRLKKDGSITAIIPRLSNFYSRDTVTLKNILVKDEHGRLIGIIPTEVITTY